MLRAIIKKADFSVHHSSSSDTQGSVNSKYMKDGSRQ